jgi:hypothetical protein
VQIQRSYVTRDVTGAPVSLLDAYLRHASAAEAAGGRPPPVTRAGGFVGFPSGCGDCCAPKLLHEAAARGLRPVSMVEFFYGAPPGTATRAKPPAAPLDLSRGGRPAAGARGGGRRGRGGGAPRGAAPQPSRRHGQVYGMCDKCAAILGTLLHGLPECGDEVGAAGPAEPCDPVELFVV